MRAQKDEVAAVHRVWRIPFVLASMTVFGLSAALAGYRDLAHGGLDRAGYAGARCSSRWIEAQKKLMFLACTVSP